MKKFSLAWQFLTVILASSRCGGKIGFKQGWRQWRLTIKTGAATEVAHSDVTQVKGQNLSTGGAIAIAVAVAAGVTPLVIDLVASADD